MPPSRRVQLALASTCLLFTAEVLAQGVCLRPETTGFTQQTDSSLSDQLVFSALGDISGSIGGAQEISGGFQLVYRDGELTAERANISSDRSSIEVIGDVSLSGPTFTVFGEDAQVDRLAEQISFSAAGFELPERPARGSAEDIVVNADQSLSLRELIFTTCPEEQVDWQLIARELEINTEEGFGKARGVTLRFKRVPILYAPVFSFPVDDRRKSGFLPPQIAERDRTGFDLTVPYYLNLAPNYDLLLEPRYMEKRGFQLRSQFRYLIPSSQGTLNVEQIPDDRVLDRSRHFYDYEHSTQIGRNVRLLAEIEDVSDPAYFEDLGNNLGVISQTHLERVINLGYFGNRWSLVTRLQEYQTIDPEILPIDKPYERLPQMLFTGRWGDRLVGFDAFAEAVQFERAIGETGWRLDTTQELSLRFARAGMYLTPAIGFRQTNYQLDRALPGQATSHSRGLPVTSVDAGMRFERLAGRERSWIQTIEPRLLYVRIPFEDQDDLPVFDTILPDFNLVQLFSKYTFVGGDRVADTNQVSFGLTSRLIESASGRERLSATLGQIRFRDPRRVQLPDETIIDSSRSNYVAELGITLSEKWNLDLGHQWNGETRETVRTETRFEFRPQSDRLFGVAYRMREGSLEQGDLSAIWPVGDRWRLIGSYSYSLLEQRMLEQVAGIEYEACCWLIRLINRRYIVRSTGETDSTISFAFELRGLAQGQATPDELLGRGILGYRPPDQYTN